MEKLTIIKVGGKIVEEETTLQQLLSDFAALPGYKLLVHGGGRSATKLATQMGIDTRMINGRRITDEPMLNIVVMVYGGLVNKHIVAKLQAKGLNAIGLTGADMNIIRSVKRPVTDVDYGFVGDVEEVNGSVLADLIHQNMIPVLAPLTHDGNGRLLNTNADTIAGEIAKTLATFFDVTLVYCFEKKGVLLHADDEESVIPIMTKADYEKYVSDGVIKDGMIPKLDNAFSAIDKGVSRVIITSAATLCSGGGTIIKSK